MMWLAGERIGGQLVDQVFTVILARLLLPRDFGLLAMVSIFTALLRVFASIGLGAAIIQRAQIDDEYLDTAFWANLGLGSLLFAVAAVSGELVGRFMGEPAVGLILLILSTRFVINAGSEAQRSLISRQMNYRILSLRSIKARVIGGLVGVTMALFGLGYWSLVGQMMTAVTASTVLLYRATGWRPRRRFSWPKFRDQWSFGAPLLFSRMFGYAIRNMDNLLVGRYLGTVALGFYALGYTIFLVPLQDVGLIVNRVMFSALSRLQQDEDRLRSAFLRATQYVTLAALPAMVGLAIVAAPAVQVIFGARWLPAAPVVSILALAGFLQLMTTLGPSGLQAAGRPDLQLRWVVISALIYLPAFAIGLRWGITGVAAGYLAATIVVSPVQYWFIGNILKVSAREMWVAVRPGVIGSAAMIAAVLPAHWALRTATPAIVELGLVVPLGVTVYGMVIWLVHRQILADLMRLLRHALPGRWARRLGEVGEG
jgi:PST family polysaccharide transporter